MKHIYDFSLEVPTPKAPLDSMNEIINRQAKRVWKDEPVVPLPSPDDETEIMGVLFGLGRLVEVNVRMAWENFARQEELKEAASPTSYKDVIKLIDKYIKNDPVHWLFKNVLTITDGMVHGNFYQAYVQAQKAYEKDDIDLTQSYFVQQKIVTATFTAAGLKIDAKTGVATTASGDPVPHKSFVPSKGKTIEENFEAFYVSAIFVPVYDVLLFSFCRAYHYRKCISGAVKADQTE